MTKIYQSSEPERGGEAGSERHLLRMEYALMERALHASQSGILITDSLHGDNPIIWCNPGFMRLTGYSIQEIIGRNCRFLQGPDTSPETIRQLREAVEQGEPLHVEILNYRKDGSPFWNDLNISPVYDSAGRLTHFVGIQQEITSRRARSEEEIRRAFQYAEQVVSTAREPLLILDNDLCVVTANLSFYRTFGVSFAETENVPLYELGDGQWNIPELRRLLEEVLPRDSVITDFEVTHSFPHIGPRTMLLNARAIASEGVLPPRILLAIEDITHRQDTLDGSVDFARSVIDALAAHIAILDETGTIVAVNHAWSQFAQENEAPENDPNTGVGTNYFDICGAADGEDASPALAMANGIRAVMQGQSTLFEFEYPCHAPWEKRWFLARVTRLNYRGRPYTIVAHENITKRKLSEEAQLESEEKYRLLAEGLPQFVWLEGAEGEAAYANPYFYAYTGLTPEAYRVGGWMQALHPDDMVPTLKRFKQARGDNQPFILDHRFFRQSDRTYRWHQSRIAPVLDSDGTLLQWVGTAVDVDEQRRAEQEQERHLAEIEELNIRLRRAIQETHHRVKNNLQVINALLEMNLLSDGGMVPTRELQRIMRHIGALATIHDLLTQQLRSEDDISEVSAKSVLERLIDLLKPTVGERKLVIDVADVMLPMQKATSLAVLVNELVSNAIKHSRGEIELTLKVTDQEATLAVCDDGAGFPPNFDPRRSANTGLELIESAVQWDLRGQVTYDNHPGGGGRVTVIFPLSNKDG